MSDGWESPAAGIDRLLPAAELAWMEPWQAGKVVAAHPAAFRDPRMHGVARSLRLTDGRHLWFLVPSLTGADGEWAAFVSDPSEGRLTEYPNFGQLFRTERARGGYRWVAARGGRVPIGAATHGQDVDGEPLWLCRARLAGGLHPAKVALKLGGANVAYGGEEHLVDEYEVLMDAGVWRHARGDEVPHDALACGWDSGGEPLYAVRAPVGGGDHQLGKVRPGFGAANIGFGFREETVERYEILVDPSQPPIEPAVTAAEPADGRGRPTQAEAWSQRMAVLLGADSRPEAAPDVVLPTGRVIASDAIILYGSESFTVTVEPGTYPLRVWREPTYNEVAALQLVIRDEEVTSWEMAVLPGENAAGLEDESFFGFPVDSGRATLADLSVVALNAGAEDWSDIKADYPGVHNRVLDPVTGANVVEVTSGGGDGSYPTYIGRTASGEVACFVTDFLIT